MADVKISALPLATTPLAGTEVLPIVQSATTDQVSVANLTAGRAVSALSLTLTGTPLAVGSGGTGLTSLTAGYIPFGGSTTYSSDSNLFWDNTNKRLGVGTSSPVNLLDAVGGRVVSRAANTTTDVLVEAQVSDYWSVPTYTGTGIRQYGNSQTGTTVGLSNSGLGSLQFQNVTAGLVYVNNSSPLVFATNNTERMRIASDGSVGIGTTSITSGAKLDVNGTIVVSNVGGYLSLPSASVGGNGVVLQGDANANSRFWSIASNTSAYGTLDFKVSSTNALSGLTSKMLLTADGNLLVGTTTSSARLYVKGSGATGSTNSFLLENSSGTQLIKARDDGLLLLPSTYSQTTASAANIYIDSSGFIYRSTSSQRYKSNIQNAVHGLSDLQKLRSVTYNGINDGNKIFGGLISEEVDAAGLTEFVVYDSKGQPDALHYGNMAGLFVKAIQELAAKVAELEAKI